MSGTEAGGAEVDPLIGLRGQISEVTDQIVHLLDMRTALAVAIGEEKARRGATQIRDPQREAEVRAHAVEIGDGTTPPEGMARIIQVIMDVASERQAEVTGLPLGEPTGSRPVRPGDVPRRDPSWQGW